MGKHLSEETKEKLRNANLGKKMLEETKAKIKAASLAGKYFYGKHHTDKSKAVIFQTHKGKYGEKCGKSILTNAQAAEIRHRMGHGEHAPLLSREYGVSIETIYRIKHGVTYRDAV